MKPEFNVENAIRTRSSVRTYADRSIDTETLNKLRTCMETHTNPFSGKVRLRLLESEEIEAQKLGTYGVIKGAKYFIGAAVTQGDGALEALGYELEQLILYAASLQLGTCWLGGTFNRGRFAKAMELQDNELFPIVTPIGYTGDKPRLVENLMRKVAKSDKRKPWEILFFQDNFATPLLKENAGQYASILEMVRLGPSASNLQPWRILKQGSLFHFYEAKAKGYGEHSGYDIQKVDLGIAACHFHLSAAEKGLEGEFKKLSEAPAEVPENLYYLFTWESAAQ